MEQNPLISVIVPVYNVAPYLARCVDSLLGQTYRDLEVVLVNDGSKDNTAKICRKRGYNLLDLPVNLGLAGAF